MDRSTTHDAEADAESIGWSRMAQSEVMRLEEMRTFINEQFALGRPAREMAREAGISDTTLSQFRHDKYEANPAQVLAKLERWKRKFDHGPSSHLPMADAWIDTPTGQRIDNTIAFAQTTPSIVVIYGNPGLGKTTAIARYARMNPNVWVVTCKPSTGGNRACIRMVGEAVGLKGLATTPDQVSSDIVSRMRGTGGLLVVDEAQHLSVDAFEELRSVHDVAGVGLALCGNDFVYTKVTGRLNRSHFAQLASRIGRRLKLRSPSVEDVGAFLAHWQITGDAEVEYGRQIGTGSGGLRSLNRCLSGARFIAESTGQPVDVALMRGAHYSAAGDDE
jgi:DNA transposition AAA+ family ATPase